jgi:hypothetical protein
MTMTTARPRASRATIRQATALAASVINGRRLPPQVSAEQLAAAFGRALAVTAARSEHGQVLTAALQDRPLPRRSPAERAAWWLAARGQTPTAQAVAKRLAEAQAQQERAEERRQAAEQLARRDGPRAAQYAAGVIQSTGTGPTWRELGQAMGWPEWSWPAVIGRLERAGYLATGSEPRSLRPGDRGRQ